MAEKNCVKFNETKEDIFFLKKCMKKNHQINRPFAEVYDSFF